VNDCLRRVPRCSDRRKRPEQFLTALPSSDAVKKAAALLARKINYVSISSWRSLVIRGETLQSEQYVIVQFGAFQANILGG
jgi:hypothetical protein